MIDAVFDAARTVLSARAFTLFGAATTWTEVVSFVTGAACVWLVARQHWSNWPIGNLNAAAFLALFWLNGLFADGALQIVYIALGFYGWWAWLRDGRRPDGDRGELAISHTSPAQWVVLAAVTSAGAALIWWFLAAATTSTVPFWDALTTAVSLAATWGQCRKKVESWWLWMAVDVAYVPLYGYKGLWLTALLYVGFFCLCVAGLKAWRADLAGRVSPVGPDGRAVGLEAAA